MDHISKFIDFMATHDCAPAYSSDIKADGAWHDFQIAGDAAGKKKGFYTLKIDGSFVSGAVGDRRHGETYQYWGKQDRKLTDEERRAYAKKREAEKKAQEQDRLKKQTKVAEDARAKWKDAKPAEHPYLTRKKIGYEWSRVLGESLLIPMYADGALWGVQEIDKDGEKLFAWGGRKKGCYCAIVKVEDDKSTILICEGFATGVSLREATGLAVVAAFDCGNLKPVAQAMREKYPGSLIVIAADNDHSKEKNAGLEAGRKAAQEIDGILVYPQDISGTDFNDMACEQSLEAVKKSVVSQIAARVEERESSSVTVEPSDLHPPSYFDEIPIEAYEGAFALPVNTDWRSLLITNPEGKLQKSSLQNVIQFLLNHQEYEDMFRLNDFQKEIYVTRCPKWEPFDAFKVHKLDDSDITQTAASIEKFGLSPDCDKVYKAIRVVAEKNKFHPAREYFNGLEWDGRERLKNWLSYYMGAEEDNAEYLALIGKKWLTAGVARVFEAGCKFDHVLINEGPQGTGKSTAFRVLATFGRDTPESYFTDAVKLHDIQNKDSTMALQGNIIIELAELSGFGKKEDEEIKHWITTQVDRCRLPYGKTVVDFPRQFILGASTNNYNYLKDQSGGRRFWPFKGQAVDLKALEEDKEQLWAEAVAAYKSGYRIWLNKDESALAKAAQDRRLQHDPWEDDVVNALKNLGSLLISSGFKVRDVMEGMGIQLRDRDAKNTRRVTGILRQIGYEDKMKWRDGKPQRLWIKRDGGLIDD